MGTLHKTNYVTTFIFSSFWEPISFRVNDAEETHQPDLNFQDRGMCVLAVCWQRLARFVDFVGSPTNTYQTYKNGVTKKLDPKNNPGWKLPRKKLTKRSKSSGSWPKLFQPGIDIIPKLIYALYRRQLPKGFGCLVALLAWCPVRLWGMNLG